jgi:iron complex transport system substrate-binding protein
MTDAMKKCLLSPILVLLLGLSPQLNAQAGPQAADALGRMIRLAGPAQRIVSLSPASTEILFAIGAADRLVGVTSYCNYPPEARKKQTIGGYAANTLSFERIRALRPELVIGDAPAHGGLVRTFEGMRLPFFLLGSDSVDAVFRNIAAAGDLTGMTVSSSALVAALRKRMARLQAALSDLPRENRPRVFWETWDTPLMTAGRRSFLGQLVDLAGGRNIFADLEAEWPTVNPEDVIRRNPEVILGPDSHADRLTVKAVADRPGWRSLDAVKNRRIYLLDADITSRAGPRLAEALELIATCLHPGRIP